MYVVKAYLLTADNAVSEIRRIVFDSCPSLCSLLEKIRSVYAIRESQPVRLQWLDSDGDRVVFSTDAELADALSCSRAAEQEALKVFVGQPPCAADTLHPNVFCDGCECAIRGYRFKCVICSNFDLCSGCMAAGGHSEHPMLLLRRPRDPFHCRFNRWNRSSWARCRQEQGQSNLCRQVMREIDRVAKRCAKLQGWYGAPAAAPSAASSATASSSTTASSSATATSSATGAEADRRPPSAGDMLQVVNSVSASLNSILQPLGIDVSWYAGQESRKQPDSSGSVRADTVAGQTRQRAEPAADTSGQAGDTSGQAGDTSGQAGDTSGQAGDTSGQAGDTSGQAGDSSGQAGDSSDTGLGDLVMVDADGDPERLAPVQLPQHVATSLQQMLAMGFTDDDGQLAKLLVRTDGDIDRALDAIRQS